MNFISELAKQKALGIEREKQAAVELNSMLDVLTKTAQKQKEDNQKTMENTEKAPNTTNQVSAQQQPQIDPRVLALLAMLQRQQSTQQRLGMRNRPIPVQNATGPHGIGAGPGQGQANGSGLKNTEELQKEQMLQTILTQNALQKQAEAQQLLSILRSQGYAV